jgi:hypothetical protein
MIGTNNIDTNSRLCMSSAVAAYKQTLARMRRRLLRRHRRCALPVHRRIEHRMGAPDPVSPHRGRACAQCRREGDRRRPAAYGDGGLADLHLGIEPGTTSRCSTACCT